MTKTTLEKIVTHMHVSLFGMRYRGDEYLAECFLRRDVTVTSVRGRSADEAVEGLWAEIQRQFPDRKPYPMPPGL